MTLEEFREKSKDEEWAPGWDSIGNVFEQLYPDQKPAHYATNMVKRAIFGGDQFLDGYSIYDSPNGYKHIVTFGMTCLYAEEKRLGKEWNKWGYEMTIKLKEKDIDKCMWAIDMLSNLARYTYKTERFLEPYQFISGGGESICSQIDSKITSLLIVPDTEANGIDTIYGRTDFLQMVGITEQELKILKQDPTKAKLLADKIMQDNPYLVTDLNRKESYLV